MGRMDGDGKAGNERGQGGGQGQLKKLEVEVVNGDHGE